MPDGPPTAAGRPVSAPLPARAGPPDDTRGAWSACRSTSRPGGYRWTGHRDRGPGVGGRRPPQPRRLTRNRPRQGRRPAGAEGPTGRSGRRCGRALRAADRLGHRPLLDGPAGWAPARSGRRHLCLHRYERVGRGGPGRRGHRGGRGGGGGRRHRPLRNPAPPEAVAHQAPAAEADAPPPVPLADTHPDTHADTHPDAVADAADTDSDAHPEPHRDAHADADCRSHPGADTAAGSDPGPGAARTARPDAAAHPAARVAPAARAHPDADAAAEALTEPGEPAAVHGTGGPAPGARRPRTTGPGPDPGVPGAEPGAPGPDAAARSDGPARSGATRAPRQLADADHAGDHRARRTRRGGAAPARRGRRTGPCRRSWRSRWFRRFERLRWFERLLTPPRSPFRSSFLRPCPPDSWAFLFPVCRAGYGPAHLSD